MKSIFKLSKTASSVAIHFLGAELPIEGKLNRNMFSLFYSIWTNPQMKIFDIERYLLQNSNENSRTWIIRLRQICKMYSLEDPLSCLLRDPPAKSLFKETVLTKIVAFHENELKIGAINDSRLQYFNVSLCNLRGRAHPAVRDMISTCEVKQSKYHIKMMINDFLTYEVKSQQSGGSPRCRLCTIDDGKCESISHIISCCPSYHDIRQKIISEMRVICENIKYINFDSIVSNNQTLTQFVLNASSLNLNPCVNIDDSYL